MLHDWKYASKRSESFGFYCYLCHACCGFLCLWIRNTKVSENADMAKTWATKCCSGTYKNNYQLCCGIKGILKPFSFVLENEDKEHIEELYLVDDDISIIGEHIMPNISQDLDTFFDNILQETKQ